jgi:UDP-N-acetylmuramate: L-alanyl-gamma-D-glutamyl-meso-diaminopimelate ligase
MGQSYHFIAIGGAVMHQLAIYLLKQGNVVSGSDDVIFEPASSNLAKNGILPKTIGWNSDNIHEGLDGIILGMHAKADNIELLKALELNIPVYSFPEFIYEHSKNKKRVVIAGSHGKTSITSMIMHILQNAQIEFDYLVGSSIKGFDTMVKVSDAPLIIIEGDEYLTSPLDSRSKFLHYHPHIAVISGIAWDHINVFPTYDSYLATFKSFITTVSDSLIYYRSDADLQELVAAAHCNLIPYGAFEVNYTEHATILNIDEKQYELQIFGKHNMENAKAAVLIAEQLGISIHQSLAHLQSFEGAAKRLESIFSDEEKGVSVYRDFAHAPSKLNASLNALREKYPKERIVALFELHTFSSLQEDFLPHYHNCLQSGDVKVLFLDKEAMKIKNRPDIEDATLLEAFGDATIQIIRSKEDLEKLLYQHIGNHIVYAFMSSGNFGGFPITEWIETNFVKK